MRSHPYRAVSVGRLAAIAGNAFIGLTRLKVFYVVLLVLAWREHIVLRETALQMSNAAPDQRNDALRVVDNAGFNLNLFSAIALIYVKGCVLAALTLLVSTFASTTIFTTFTMVFVYF